MANDVMKHSLSIATLIVSYLSIINAHGQLPSEFKATVNQPGVPQTNQGFSIVDYSYKKTPKTRFFVVYDGVPVYKLKRFVNMFEKVDKTLLDSTFMLRGPIKRCGMVNTNLL